MDEETKAMKRAWQLGGEIIGFDGDEKVRLMSPKEVEHLIDTYGAVKACEMILDERENRIEK